MQQVTNVSNWFVPQEKIKTAVFIKSELVRNWWMNWWIELMDFSENTSIHTYTPVLVKLISHLSFEVERKSRKIAPKAYRVISETELCEKQNGWCFRTPPVYLEWIYQTLPLMFTNSEKLRLKCNTVSNVSRHTSLFRLLVRII